MDRLEKGYNLSSKPIRETEEERKQGKAKKNQ